jgi:exopolysaccharide biosynthesis protein
LTIDGRSPRRRIIILSRLSLFIAVASLLSACNLPIDILPALRFSPEASSAPESDWRDIADGLQWRRLLPKGDELAQLVVVRIDPSLYRFRARYRPGQPTSLADWRALEADASVLVNANFFDSNHEALGLVVSDGVESGIAYRERGGTFLIRHGAAAVIANRSQDFPANDGIEQAVQGFPLLVENGRQAYFASANGERTRRTLIADDKNGDILILVAPLLGLSLGDLSAYLPTTDLEIETAFNLDGGGSSMIALPGADYFQPSFDPAPAILAVYPGSGD